jgi:K+-transporting ATPase ATPase A chain
VTAYSLISIVLPLALVAICMVPLGRYMARVYSGERVFLTPALGWLESLLYRLCGVDRTREMAWREYAAAVLLFAVCGFALLFLIVLFQHVLPLNPQGFAGLSPDLAFNVSASFLTNTNWQSYGGETTLSYFSQAIGLTVQNFVSAATGLAVAVALFRGIARKQTEMLGNFWVDMVRGLLYLLLPLALVFALFLVSQGVVQNFKSYTPYIPLEVSGVRCQVSDKIDSGTCNLHSDTLIAQGPAASQVSIKMLGSNGGGFFNANAAHPFENPTPLSNLLQMVAILLIPASLLVTYGVMVGDKRQGWMLCMAMTAVLLPFIALSVYWEQSVNPLLPSIIDQSAGNMEGKETRIGAVSSAMWSVLTTATSSGSVNAAHDSLMPLSGLAPLLLLQFGEVIFGGVGVGIYGMLMYVFITVFIGGLMVGRTPEYMGKKLGVPEIKITLLIIIIPPTMALFGTAVAVATEAGRAGVFNPGAQGFSEVLYAFASASNNNGSAFAGLSANSPFYNIALGLCMLLGRYGLIVLALALAGALSAKNATPQSAGTLPTHTPLFALLLVFVILLNSLTYIPSIALGPVAEHVHLFPAGVAKP